MFETLLLENKFIINDQESKQNSINGQAHITYFDDFIENLKLKMCFPYILNKKKIFQHQNIKEFYLIDEFSYMLKDSSWIDFDMSNKTLPINQNNIDKFYEKYGNIPLNCDARYGVNSWKDELEHALSHISKKALAGNLLHIGCDSFYEPEVLHPNAESIILSDVSFGLLERANKVTRNNISMHTRADELLGINNNSIDLYVALRVYSSYGFNIIDSIQQAIQKMKYGGAMLLSISNGYLAKDDTILPGQITGKQPYLSFSKPYDDANLILSYLHDFGFKELFLVPGSSELFLGGTLLPSSNSNDTHPILHIGSESNVPICFYSEKMPTSWLGNYSPHSIIIDGESWTTVEHYFQSQKFDNNAIKELIKKNLNPDNAKKTAWKFHEFEKNNWNSMKLDIMKKAVQCKFDQYPDLKTALLRTNLREIIELSSTDSFWGKRINGNGKNNMGKILMEIRESYKKN